MAIKLDGLNEAELKLDIKTPKTIKKKIFRLLFKKIAGQFTF